MSTCKTNSATTQIGSAHLFSPLTIGGITLRNRIAVSPMCQYSAKNGHPTDWHLVHLGSRAVGGAALVMFEASAVSDIGRISPDDTGIWSDEHVASFAPIAKFIKEQGAVPAIQLAHAGRKASTYAPWKGSGTLTRADGCWETVGPAALAFSEQYHVPRALDQAGIDKVVDEFAQAARRAVSAGFQIVEIHSAHGYLLHSFLSPLSNTRGDNYGGSFENRCRFLMQVTAAVRAEIPKDMPLFVRISATDWAEGGWNDDEATLLAGLLLEHGVNLIDCSSGGNVPHARIPLKAGYQVPFAARIRKEKGIMTGAVGMITDARQANAIIKEGQADIVLLARQFLRDPYWPLHAAAELEVEIDWPAQYARAK